MSIIQMRLFFFFLLATTCCVMAQDTIQSSPDTKYREDQFYIGATYNLITQVPDDVNIRGLSGGVHFGFVRDIPFNQRRNLAIAVGAGLSFDRYGQTLFIGETDSEKTIFSVLDDDINYDTNRFSTAAIEAPIEFRWRTSTAESYKFWRIYAGLRVGYVYWYKSTFKQTDNNVNQTDIPEFDRTRLGLTLSFGYNTFNFYGYYSINPFFTNAATTDGQQVDFKTIKVGLIFYIL
ncbi:porin family protein [Constantimarinum furrinae]|uniref:Outer membrane protein beta-barrel domain-containing protein n=1 Tax=Constantimarinum furrinae TaxID=2562285 RepID=A0A7G8PTS9_9FLAO|nr:porin family protein [Constantimarinum furrinae]QNJ97745.1 hypothetical protein ALE3EI_1176 [Constantimarinum furrinae]